MIQPQTTNDGRKRPVKAATIGQARRPQVSYDPGWTERIPAELRERPRWVVWRYEWRPDRNGGGKWTKVPYQPRTVNGRRPRAKANDPKTWGTHAEALAAYQAHAKRTDAERLDGIGFQFLPEDGFVGIDLDNCLTPDGKLMEWADERLGRLGPTYAEISPSERGIKAFYRGSLPARPDGSTGRRRGGYGPDGSGEIEVYDRARYFTLTGNLWPGAPATINVPTDGALDALAAALDDGRHTSHRKGKGREKAPTIASERQTTMAPAVASNRQAGHGEGTPTLDTYRQSIRDVSDDALLKRARNARNGAKFSALYDKGDISGYPSQSHADEALLAFLAFWTGEDESRMERMFDASALGRREKWADRPDYRARSIRKAIAKNNGKRPERPEPPGRLRPAERNGHPSRPSADNGDGEPPNGAAVGTKSLESLTDEELGIIGADTCKPKPPKWLWDNRIARAKFNLTAGEGGDGKSQIKIAIVASITTGRPLPDGSLPLATGKCLILSAEDGAADTLVPRLIAAEADLSRVKFLTAKITQTGKDGRKLISPMSFQDLPYWREIFRRHPDTVLLIADPLPAYLGRGVNDHRNNDVRAVLEPFIDLLDETGIGMSAVTHLNKSTDGKPTHRILGSVAYANLARTVHVTCRDPEDKNRRMFCWAKGNLTDTQPTLAYKIVGCEITNDQGEVIKTSRLEFEAEPVDADATDLMGNPKSLSKRGPDPAKTRQLAEWLYDYLEKYGKSRLGEIFEAAGMAGLIGRKREEDGKWSLGKRLYDAFNHVPRLEEPRDGKRVETFQLAIKPGGRELTHWYLTGAETVF